MTEGKHYIRADGNGGINISTSMMALVTLTLLVLGSLASTVYAYGSLNNKVDQLETYFQEAGPRHTAEMDAVRLRLDATERSNTIVTTKLDQIQSDLKEVKTDLKEHMADSPNS
jgi:Tfp pilus assembly protein PilX